MNIAIIGAGWYGCHIAMSLIQQGKIVDIYEQANSSISGASKRNQNRLHLGFHYPRDAITRNQSKEGFQWFIEHYPHLVSDVDNNFYAVAKNGSYIDEETYNIIMSGSGLEFKIETGEFCHSFRNIGSLISCDEKVIRNDLASDFFNDVLSKHLHFGRYVDLNNPIVVDALEAKYDLIIDCTWGRAKNIPDVDYFFEPCIYFYYKNKTKNSFALTIMDGKHYSLYPYYSDIYTLTSVEHTPLGVFNDINQAIAVLSKSKLDKGLIKDKKSKFEREFCEFYPEFLQHFEFVSVEFSMKTKIVSSTDYRGCFVKKEGKVISIFSGKIDTLHIAEKEVNRIIGENCDVHKS